MSGWSNGIFDFDNDGWKDLFVARGNTQDNLALLSLERDYWLTDYYAYDLMAPPYGYEWVRYGDDALLVNIYTGEILQVEYDVFY